MKINFDDAAVLVWLPIGEEPMPSHFSPNNDLGPPNPNPEPWWVLGQALIHSRTVQGEHGKEPWIKVGSVVLAPVQVLQAYEAFKTGRDYYA
jgi:hypothetical protein